MDSWRAGAPPQDYFKLVAYGSEAAPWELETPQPMVVKAVSASGVLEQYIGSGTRVLDLCCGVGRHSVLLALRGCDVIGVDVNDIALERARRHWSSAKQQHPQPIVGSVSFLHCDLLSPNTWDEALLTPFDIVIDTAAFHCFDKELWPKYMDAWVRATKPGSRVLFLNFAYVGCNLYEAMQDSETLMNTPPDTLRNTQE